MPTIMANQVLMNLSHVELDMLYMAHEEAGFFISPHLYPLVYTALDTIMKLVTIIFTIFFCYGSMEAEAVEHINETNADILHNVTITIPGGFENIFPSGIFDMKLDDDGRYIYAAEQSAVWRLDPVTKTKTLLAGSLDGEYGYVEGIGEEVRFEYIETITVTSNEVIVSDVENDCLRKIDLLTKQSSPYAGICNLTGYKDGLAGEALFNKPIGQLAHKSGLFVSDRNNDALRLILNGTVSTILSGDPLHSPTYLADMDSLVFIINGLGVGMRELLSFNPENKSVEIIQSVNSGWNPSVFPGTGPFKSFGPRLLLIVDWEYLTVQLVDFTKNKMSLICNVKHGEDGYVAESPSLNTLTCGSFNPYSLEIYRDTVLVGLDDGSLATIPLNVIVPGIQSCPPSEVTHEMNSCVNTVNLEIEGQHFSLPEGQSLLKLKLPHGIICNVNVTVAMRDVPLSFDKGEKTASWYIKEWSGKTIRVNFPIGVHTFEVEGTSGARCKQTVRVYDNKVAQRKIVLRVSYPLLCDKVNGVSMISINTTLLHQYADLKKACSECALASGLIYPDITCKSDLLTVSWKTNINISLENPDLPKTTKDDLISKLRETQLASLKLHGQYLDITIINLNPPVVSPVIGSNGLALNPVVVSSCPISGMIYNQADDICQFPRP